MNTITVLLEDVRKGTRQSADQLLALVYQELRALAAAKMARESAAQTLQPTALVHEAWLRLGGDQQSGWESRRHFFGAAAEAMRQILIEKARRRQTVRHGGGRERVDADAIDLVPAGETGGDQVLAVSEALECLATHDAEKAELVKLRYFVGLTIEEAAAAMGIAETTAKRWWIFSRSWLAREIRRQDAAGK